MWAYCLLLHCCVAPGAASCLCVLLLRVANLPSVCSWRQLLPEVAVVRMCKVAKVA